MENNNDFNAAEWVTGHEPWYYPQGFSPDPPHPPSSQIDWPKVGRNAIAVVAAGGILAGIGIGYNALFGSDDKSIGDDVAKLRSSWSASTLPKDVDAQLTNLGRRIWDNASIVDRNELTSGHGKETPPQRFLLGIGGIAVYCDIDALISFPSSPTGTVYGCKGLPNAPSKETFNKYAKDYSAGLKMMEANAKRGHQQSSTTARNASDTTDAFAEKSASSGKSIVVDGVTVGNVTDGQATISRTFDAVLNARLDAKAVSQNRTAMSVGI